MTSSQRGFPVLRARGVWCACAAAVALAALLVAGCAGAQTPKPAEAEASSAAPAESQGASGHDGSAASVQSSSSGHEAADAQHSGESSQSPASGEEASAQQAGPAAIQPVFAIPLSLFADSGAIHDDGVFLDLTAAVPELLQGGVMEGGCEIVSMTSVLRALGFSVEPGELVENYLEYDPEGSDFVYYYSGSPYDTGMGYPPGMAQMGNRYLTEQRSQWRFNNATGADFEELEELVGQGRPVLVWTTMYFDDPMHTDITASGYEYYENEHCVVLLGTHDGTVLVMDPLEGMVERDRDRFKQIYDDTGRMCLVLAYAYADLGNL